MEGEGKPWGNFNPVRQHLHWSRTLTLTELERWPFRVARTGELIIEALAKSFPCGLGPCILDLQRWWIYSSWGSMKALEKRIYNDIKNWLYGSRSFELHFLCEIRMQLLTWQYCFKMK